MSYARATLLTLTVLATACSLPHASNTVAGPSFSLDAEVPVAAFSVELCMKGPAVDHVHPAVRVSATASLEGGVSQLLLAETLDADPADAQTEYPRFFDREDVGHETELSFELEAEHGPWEGHSGRRCIEVQTVQFDAPELVSAETMTIDWEVTFSAEYDNGMFARDGLDNGDLIINIERI